MVGTIETIHAIEARENMMDARAYHVSSYLNSTTPFPFKLCHAGWLYLDDCDCPKPALRQDDRDDYITQTQLRKRVLFCAQRTLFLFTRDYARYRTFGEVHSRFTFRVHCAQSSCYL